VEQIVQVAECICAGGLGRGRGPSGAGSPTTAAAVASDGFAWRRRFAARQALHRFGGENPRAAKACRSTSEKSKVAPQSVHTREPLSKLSSSARGLPARAVPQAFADRRSVSGNAEDRDGEGIAGGNGNCGYAAGTLAGSSSRWQWALLPLIAIMVSGMALAFLAETVGLRKVGIGIFVVSAAGYVAARIVLLWEKRSR
jgi:hypothetical protein